MMNFEEISFPIEGNVQNYVHFMDSARAYSFTFASPFQYKNPEDLKSRKAFLLGAFDPYHGKTDGPEKVYLYYVVDEKQKPYAVKESKASVKKVSFFDGEHQPLGSMDILLPGNFFRSYKGYYPNLIYDNEGRIVGFCHYQMDRSRKVVYTFSEGFDHLYEEITPKQAREWENSGELRPIFSYDLIHLEADSRSRLEAIFSPSKKSELVNNRINMIRKPQNTEEGTLLIASLFAFFWSTYIDLPMSK